MRASTSCREWMKEGSKEGLEGERESREKERKRKRERENCLNSYVSML